MILGFNEYFDELLLEAKSPEEVVRILSYKHPEVPESLIKTLVETDPTKKKTYAGWALNVEKDPRKILSYLTSGKLRKIFDYFRDAAKDGASLVDRKSLEDAERYLPDFSNIFSHDEQNPEANDYEIKIETPEWIVATPDSYAASKKLGENTKWCTADAYGNGRYYYNDYTSSGPLWINFDKRHKETLNGVTYPFKRYQFCFERKAFLDARDDPFNWEDIDMPEDVQKMYEDMGYDLEDLTMSTEERWEDYSNRRWENAMWVFDGLTLMRGWDDDYNWGEGDDENYDYYLYDENDDVDPISDSQVYGPDSIVYRNENLDYAILKERAYWANNGGQYTIAIKQQESTRRGTGINLYTQIENFKLLGNNGSRYVAYIDKHDTLVYLAYEGMFTVNDFSTARSFSENADIFLNTALSNDDAVMYIEVSDEGTHALYRVSYPDVALLEIIANDIPANGKQFTLNEKGRIDGKYGTYSPTGEYGEEDETRYAPVKTLANKDLLLCRNQAGQCNIFSTSKINEKLFDKDFDTILADLTDTNYNGILVQTNDEKYLLSIAKRDIASGKYPYIQASNNKEVIIAANEKMVNGQKAIGDGRFIITGKGDIPVVSAYTFSIDGKNPVYLKNEEGETVFGVLNLNTLKLIGGDWIVKASTFGYFSLGSNEGRYVLAKDKKGIIYIYDWVDNKIITNGIKSDKKPDYLRDYQGHSCNNSLFQVQFVDDTFNLFSLKTGKLVFKDNPTKIEGQKLYGGTDNIIVMAGYNKGERNYFAIISEDKLANKLLNGNPVLSAGHELYPKLTGRMVTFTVDFDKNKILKLNTENGDVTYFGVHPATNRYDEIPIQQAPEEIQQLASQIFPWL